MTYQAYCPSCKYTVYSQKKATGVDRYRFACGCGCHFVLETKFAKAL